MACSIHCETRLTNPIVRSMRRTSIILCGLLTLLAAAGPVAAQTGRFQASFRHDQVTVVDTTTNHVVIGPNGRSLSYGTSLRPRIEFVPQTDGFDLNFTFTNTGNQPAPLGYLTVPGLRFGRSVSYRDFLHQSDLATADHQGRDYMGTIFQYPSLSYSPVFVVGDGSATVGVSLMYPILEYKHPVEVRLISPGGELALPTRNWEVYFWMPGEVPAGATRRYSVAVRLTADASQWIRTLVPYRDYFKRTYGDARYTRDSRPVSGVTISDPACQTAANTHGFCGPWRPDTGGWGTVAPRLRGREALGFSRMMLWNPTGFFRDHPDLNFPFQFMTAMNSFPAMRGSLGVLRAVAGPNLEVGYWWGHSQLVMDGWDNGSATVLDPHNPEHVRMAMAELDMAVSLNATTIGLDAFIGMPDWEAVDWLLALRARAPNVKFVIERDFSAPDILHVLSPTWINGRDLRTGHILADFFIPGHESWFGLPRAYWSHMALPRKTPSSPASPTWGSFPLSSMITASPAMTSRPRNPGVTPSPLTCGLGIRTPETESLKPRLRQ